MNKKNIALVVAVVLGASVVIAGVAAQNDSAIPRVLTYSGYLEQSGAPLTQTGVDIAFELLAANNGILASETQNIDVTAGRFSATLFAGLLDDTVLSQGDLRLRITIGGQILSPPQALAPAMFALRAESADRLSFRGAVSDYTTGAGFCGQTAAITGAITEPGFADFGYPRAKELCEAVPGCSSGAHMCTSDEMVRDATLRRSPAAGEGWIAATAGNLNSIESGDCVGWTTSVDSRAGQAWLTEGGSGIQAVSISTCNNAHPIFCCH